MEQNKDIWILTKGNFRGYKLFYASRGIGYVIRTGECADVFIMTICMEK